MSNAIPIPLKRALLTLGENIRSARLKRRISTAMMAERAGISRTTLLKIEKGNPAVSMENYAMVLFVLGMTNRLAELCSPSKDFVGLDLEAERLPKRIRVSRK